MGIYGEQVLPRLVDLTCGASALDRSRSRVAEGLEGTIVEIGFGSGLNVPLYPSTITKVFAVEPAELGRKLASKRIDASPIPIEHIGLDGQSLPLEDNSCDGALCTFTLCTIPDVEAALAELRRVLKPGGRFHFLEHGLAQDPKVAKRQQQFDPFQVRFAGGCHLTRDPAQLVQAAGFQIEDVSSRFGKGPKAWSWFTEGKAVNP
ncbi:MAG TPA: class I SAM-dependent methyltransferase [Microthrixaceae bacterium]|nr:class I SAM-dependent methyltransferase [Microthrixaceae bacterium]